MHRLIFALILAICSLNALEARAEESAAAIAKLEQKIALDEGLYGLNSMTLADDWGDLVILFWKERDYARARMAAGRRVNILLRLTRGEDDVLASAYYNLALIISKLGGGQADDERLHRRSLRIRQKIGGTQYESMAYSHDFIGRLVEGRYLHGEAEMHFRAALSLREKLADFDKAWLADNAYRLADVLSSLKRYEEAEPFFRHALELFQQASPNDVKSISLAQLGLAQALNEQSRYAEAEEMGAKALAGAEGRFAPYSREFNNFRETLAWSKMARGHYAEATKLWKLYIDAHIKGYGEDDKWLLYVYPGLVASLIGEQKYDEAEDVSRFLLEFNERVEGTAFFVNPVGMDNLFTLSAGVLEIQGRLDEAEGQYGRILDSYDMFHRITDKRGGWRETGFLLRFVAFLVKRQKWQEAGRLVERAAEIGANLDRGDDVGMAGIYEAQALILRHQGKLDRAKELIAKSLVRRKKLQRPDHPDLARSYEKAAELAAELGRPGEAEDYYRQAIAIMTKVHGAENSDTARLYGKLGAVALQAGRSADAVGLFKKAAQINVDQIENRLLPANAHAPNANLGRLIGNLYDFDGLIAATHQLASEKGEFAAAAREMFVMSQWAHSSDAAFAVGQMSTRQEANPELAALLRERQDLAREHRALDDKLLEFVSVPYMQRKTENEKQIRQQIAIVAQKLKAAEDELQRKFPDHAALASPRPLTVKEVQGLLGEDEVLLSYVETSALKPLPEQTFLWAVAKRGDPLWVKLPLAPDAIAGKVATLRNLLGMGSGARAGVSLTPPRAEDFDLALAHELYQSVLEPVAPVLAGKRLVIVPSRSLSSLPFHLLVSRAPDATVSGSEGYRRAQWLIRDHAISMLPSVSSLKALRSTPQAAAERKPYMGFGNPLLLGATGTDRIAWDAQSCKTAETLVAAVDPLRNDRSLSSFFRGSRADVAEVRKLAPLPETAGELCAVAKSLKGSWDDLFFGGDATETRLKALSESGALGAARIVHFATHGLVAGDLEFLAEPALVLTPPDAPTEEDDGLLTASEVARLKLNAEWVILSACNTAAGEGGNAEALSGLARAFFYAGARSLLVSHWPVYSDAAVEITTGAFQRLSAHPKIGRAEALRQTLIATIDQGGGRAVPAYWAPFVIVGEGG